MWIKVEDNEKNYPKYWAWALWSFPRSYKQFSFCIANHQRPFDFITGRVWPITKFVGLNNFSSALWIKIHECYHWLYCDHHDYGSWWGARPDISDARVLISSRPNLLPCLVFLPTILSGLTVNHAIFKPEVFNTIATSDWECPSIGFFKPVTGTRVETIFATVFVLWQVANNPSHYLLTGLQSIPTRITSSKSMNAQASLHHWIAALPNCLYEGLYLGLRWGLP